MRQSSRTRRGLTLLELMVALALVGIVTLIARVLAERLGDAARRIEARTAAGDRDANAERLVRAVVASAEVATSDSITFAGDGERARLFSWCATPGGWLERCVVTLTRREAGDSSRFVLELPRGDSVVFPHTGRALALRYLSDARGGGKWTVSWGAGFVSPLALGLVYAAEPAERDTVILRIGERG